MEVTVTKAGSVQSLTYRSKLDAIWAMRKAYGNVVYMRTNNGKLRIKFEDGNVYNFTKEAE